MERDRIALAVRVAEKRASELQKKFGMVMPEDIRLEDIAYALGAKIIYGGLSGAAARLLRTNKGAIIRINANQHKNKARFSVAHELGHLVLEHGESFSKICNEIDLHDWYGGSEEAQANAFASELILPSAMIKPMCDVSEVSFDQVREIATKFNTSLTPAATRFVRFSPEICAIVFSMENKVKWFIASKEWPYYINVGAELGKDSLATKYFRGEKVPEDAREVWSSAWIESRKAPEELVEHTVVAPSLGFVLSLLWVTAEDDDEDDGQW